MVATMVAIDSTDSAAGKLAMVSAWFVGHMR